VGEDSRGGVLGVIAVFLDAVCKDLLEEDAELSNSVEVVLLDLLFLLIG
jgi:hypothetical protein